MTEEKKSILLARLRSNKISRDDYRLLELAALGDPFLFDALEGYGLFKTDKTKDINYLKRHIDNKTIPKNNKIAWFKYSIAASFLVVCAVSFWYFSDEFSQADTSYTSLENKDNNTSSHDIANETIEVQSEMAVSNTKVIAGNEVQGRISTMEDGAFEGNLKSESVDDPVHYAQQEILSIQEKSNPPTIDNLDDSQDIVQLEADKMDVDNEDDITLVVERKESLSNNGEVSSANLQTSQTIFGKVSGSDGQPLIGAKVTYGNQKAFTNFDGQYSFDIVLIEDTQILFSYVDYVDKAMLTEKNVQVYSHQFMLRSQGNSMVSSDLGKISRFSKASSEMAEAEREEIHGLGDFSNFVKDRLVIPSSAINNNISGQVLLQFEVNHLKELKNIKILEGLGFGCDRESVRLLLEGKDLLPFPNTSNKILTHIFPFNR